MTDGCEQRYATTNAWLTLCGQYRVPQQTARMTDARFRAVQTTDVELYDASLTVCAPHRYLPCIVCVTFSLALFLTLT